MLCDAPILVLMWISLVVPGFTVVDQPGSTPHTVTDATFFLRHSGLSAPVLGLLSVFEVFNLIRLALLSLLLRMASNLRFGRSFVVNLGLDLSAQLPRFLF